MNFSRLFRSRRAALIWAAGILWFAYDVAQSTKQDAPATSVNVADIAMLSNAF